MINLESKHSIWPGGKWITVSSFILVLKHNVFQKYVNKIEKK